VAVHLPQPAQAVSARPDQAGDRATRSSPPTTQNDKKRPTVLIVESLRVLTVTARNTHYFLQFGIVFIRKILLAFRKANYHY
jgi:hypothetical protein